MIGIIDTNAGNLASLENAITRLGKTCCLLSHPQIAGIDQLVIPGQGHFGSVMEHLNRLGWTDLLQEWIKVDRPLLGICVGLQILFETSAEAPNVRGLGIFAGNVKKLRSEKQPMIGWANVEWQDSHFPQGSAYYVNSFVVTDSTHCIATSHYGETFCAAVARSHTIAFQFHPEKSSDYGRRILAKWLV